MIFKRIIHVIILSLIFTGAFTQAGNEGMEENTPVSKVLQKMRWDMNLGTSFSFIPGYGGGMSYYAAPGFSYPVNKRISFHGGMVAGVFTTPGFADGENRTQKITSGYTSLYGTVAYHLSQNVVFYGTGVKNMATFNRMTPFYTPSFDEISFGSSIRLGDNVTIGASFHFREYNSPLQNGLYYPYFK